MRAQTCTVGSEDGHAGQRLPRGRNQSEPLDRAPGHFLGGEEADRGL